MTSTLDGMNERTRKIIEAELGPLSEDDVKLVDDASDVIRNFVSALSRVHIRFLAARAEDRKLMSQAHEAINLLTNQRDAALATIVRLEAMLDERQGE